MLRHPPMLYRVGPPEQVDSRIHRTFLTVWPCSSCEVKVGQIKGGCAKIQRLKNLHSQGFSASHPCISRHQVLSVIIVDVDKV